MFDRVTLRGGQASLLWGYRTAAVLTSWSITKTGAVWVLTATGRVDAFQCRKKPLLFTAPRDKGMWCWEISGDVLHVGPNQLRATLGQPLQ